MELTVWAPGAELYVLYMLSQLLYFCIMELTVYCHHGLFPLSAHKLHRGRGQGI